MKDYGKCQGGDESDNFDCSARATHYYKFQDGFDIAFHCAKHALYGTAATPAEMANVIREAEMREMVFAVLDAWRRAPELPLTEFVAQVEDECSGQFPDDEEMLKELEAFK